MEPLSGPGGFGLCGRRDFLRWAGVGALGWLTPLGQLLARQQEQNKSGGPARSVIVLWMAGGPSQLETFDPHPDQAIAGETKAIDTAVRGIQLAEGLDQLAAQMESVSLIRSLTSTEGDHERGTYFVKTGYKPDPTIVHPSLGAICCHQFDQADSRIDIPRHISILPGQWPARGGFLGDEYDAFKVYDPAGKLPDVTHTPGMERFDQRLKDLKVVDQAFARGRQGRIEATHHQDTIDRARSMMTSEQLKAFDVKQEPADVRKAYGDTPFGRGCLAARRLVEAGCRCVEVTLDGWDTHANNYSLTRKQVAVLDPAFAALIADLRKRDLLARTMVLCMGEFGRTPQINPAGGRDHWPEYFSVALAGGGIHGGRVIGETDPAGSKKTPTAPHKVADVHATVLTALGFDPKKTVRDHKTRRPIALSEGEAIQELLG
jgi:hypothetical protein